MTSNVRLQRSRSRAHRIVLGIECVLILLPVTYMAVWGTFFIIMLAFDGLDRAPFYGVGMICLTLACLLSLLALWVVCLHALCKWRLFQEGTEGRWLVLTHLGVVPAILALVSQAAVFFFPQLSDSPLMLVGVFIVGAPALILYAHLQYLRPNRV
jgi:hypothetical protein